MALEIFTNDDIENKKLAKLKSDFIRPDKKTNYQTGYFVITDIKLAVKNPNRVNIFVNEKYRFSLDIYQLSSLGVKIGAEFTELELQNLEQQSEFGKLYSRTLEYCLMRPHSEKEVRDYLYKKTFTKKFKNRKTGEFYEKAGVSKLSTEQVLSRLKEKDYINDARFSRWWIQNRNQRKGSSIKKLRQELQQKGVANDIIVSELELSSRNDKDELTKIIAKKSKKYPDRQKIIAYLARQGFEYSDIIDALNCEMD